MDAWRVIRVFPDESGGATVCIDGLDDIGVKGEAAALLPLDGTLLDDEETECILETLVRPALEFAAKMLGMRMMTHSMLVKRLIEKGIDETLAVLAADKMADNGAVDDLDYASVFAADRAARGWGEIRIRGELRQRGVDEDDIDSALSEIESYDDAIEAFVVRKAGNKLLTRDEADKVGAALARKGFKWDDIRPILREYTED